MVYRLKEEVASQLHALVEDAMTTVHEPLDSTEKLISDIYTGRDPLGGSARLILGDQGLPLDQVVDPNSTRVWRPPETTANLFLSRIRQIVTALTPGTPTIDVKARVPGAASMAEYQQEITQWAVDCGGLEETMRRCAFLGLLSPYFGCKLVVKPDEEYAYDRIEFIPVEPGDCGFEPFHRRFTWHSYQQQWADLPTVWRPKLDSSTKPNDWDIVQVTEVYHEGFRFGSPKIGKYPMSIFVDLGSQSSETALSASRKQKQSLGEYTYSENLPENPLRITPYLDAAPKEDVPSAEVLSWIPLMRMIVQVLVQINREVTTSNNVVLYEKGAISDDAVSVLQSSTPGSTVFIPVDVDDTTRGVNASMRPVEQSSVLQEYLASLQVYLSLFDDVTGVGPIDRGTPANPRKSATEASSIVAASNRRNRDRLEKLANLWADMARVHQAYQPLIYGDRLEIPLPTGLSRIIPVPDPVASKFTFRVDATDIGHLSRRGELDTYFNWLTTLTNVYGTFQGAMPRMIRESLRRMGKAMGIEDVDIFLDAPVIEVGPEERYIEHLQTGAPIPVDTDDQHELYISYYDKMVARAVANFLPEASVGALRRAIDEHNMHLQRASLANMQQQNQAPVPGVSAQGQVDNQIAAAMQAGMAPPATPQTLGS